MPNTSATGGYLTGTESTIEGQALDRFLNSFIGGLTGITGDLIRPMWQLNPPKIPANTVDWISFGLTITDSDANAYLLQGTSGTTMKRNEFGEMSMIFYGNNAMINAKKMRDGLQIEQNRSYLRTVGLTTRGVKSLIHIPELIGDIWYNRVDITIEFAREMQSSYNVLTILSANGFIKTETITVPFKTQ
jgi:hypothetical protein